MVDDGWSGADRARVSLIAPASERRPITLFTLRLE